MGWQLGRAGLLIDFLNGRNISIFNAIRYNPLQMETLMMQEKEGKRFVLEQQEGRRSRTQKRELAYSRNMDGSSQQRIKGNKITRNNSFREFTNKYNIQWIIGIVFLLPQHIPRNHNWPRS